MAPDPYYQAAYEMIEESLAVNPSSPQNLLGGMLWGYDALPTNTSNYTFAQAANNTNDPTFQ